MRQEADKKLNEMRSKIEEDLRKQLQIEFQEKLKDAQKEKKVSGGERSRHRD